METADLLLYSQDRHCNLPWVVWTTYFLVSHFFNLKLIQSDSKLLSEFPFMRFGNTDNTLESLCINSILSYVSKVYHMISAHKIFRLKFCMHFGSVSFINLDL
jgi:hypothetical protein